MFPWATLDAAIPARGPPRDWHQRCNRRSVPSLITLRALAVAGLSLSLACGGHTALATGDDGGGEAGVEGGGDGGEGRVDRPSWDGGLLPPSGPGYVRCGSATCGPGDQCCLVTEGAPATNGCDSLSLATCNGTQDVRDCDEQADCHPDEDCCYDVFTSPPATIGSRCGPKGSCDLAIACASSADCAESDAGVCVAQRCRGDILETCGELPTAACPP